MPETSERIAELRRELESNPASRQFYQLGELLRRDGRAAEAMAVLRAGLAHQPRYVAAWVSLGRACLDRTMPRDAAKALHEALELDAHNPVAWRLLGEARLGEGDRFGALDAMQHALQLAPGDEVLRAAVDSLASETWPPAGPAAPAPTDAAAPRKRAAAPTPEPVAASPFPPAVAEVVSPPPASAFMTASPAAASVAAAAPPPEPFTDLAPPVTVAPPSPAGGPLDDPFGVPLAAAAAAAVGADVFVLPAEPASFVDEPFGIAAPVTVQAPFLADFVEPAMSPTPAPAAEAWPDEGAQPPLVTVETAGMPAFADVGPAPALIAIAPEAAPAPPEPTVDAPAAVAPALAATPPLPAADFASTSAFAAAPLDAAVPAATAGFPVEAPPAAVERYSAPPEPPVAPAPVEPEAVPIAVAREPLPAPADPRARAAAASRPTLTLARLHLEQQDFPAAIAILERVVTGDPDNQEARDLLDLVHDMMAPLPGELPSLSARERKIAALQAWLASLTLGHERTMTR